MIIETLVGLFLMAVLYCPTKAVTGAEMTCLHCGMRLIPCDGVNHWKQGVACQKCKDQPLEGWWHRCLAR